MVKSSLNMLISVMLIKRKTCIIYYIYSRLPNKRTDRNKRTGVNKIGINERTG